MSSTLAATLGEASSVPNKIQSSTVSSASGEKVNGTATPSRSAVASASTVTETLVPFKGIASRDSGGSVLGFVVVVFGAVFLL